MLPSIHFYYQTFLKTDKVNDIFTYRMLTAELAAFKLAQSQPPPEGAFGICKIAP